MEVKDLLEELKKSFQLFLASNRKDRSLIDPLLHEAFSSSDRPHDLLLILTRDSGDFYQSKSISLSGHVLNSFEEWAKGKQLSKIEKSLKDEALFAACGQRSTHITNQIIKLFEILDESPEGFQYLVDDLIYKQKYDTASRLVSTLGLYEKVTAFQFLVPLIGQDKVNVVEDYLKQAGKDVQKELLQYLDSCLADRNKLKEKLVAMGVQLIRYDKLHSSVISKLIGRLAKKFDVSEEFLPNFCQKRIMGSIRYMAQQCFKEGTITLGNFEELSVLQVKDSRKLQMELLELLLDYREDEVALRVARTLDLPLSEWPLALRNVSQDSQRRNSNSKLRNSEEEDWSDCVAPVPVVPSRKYYQLPFPLDEVILVDSLDRFHELLAVMNKEEMIGFDAEWRPSFNRSQSPISIIQIATGRNTVYVLDLIFLNGALDEKQRLGFVNEFYREDLLVLGFGFREDLSKLNIVFPGIHEKHDTSNNVLDMMTLWGHVENKNPSVLPYKNDKAKEDRQKGLSELVRQCFDTGLDKSEQMSDWGRRPLTKAQMTYAAIDAYVLLEVFRFLSSKHSTDDWKTLIDSLMRKKTKEKRLPKNKKERKSKSVSLGPVPVSPFRNACKAPEEIKLICMSSMLGRLGRLLRSCGIDTVLTHSSHSGMSDQEVIDLASKEGRFLVSAGAPTKKLEGHLPTGHCYRVISTDPAVQLKETLHYFNIRVEMKHIFSRCQKCNGIEYHKLSQCKMIRISEAAAVLPSPNRNVVGGELPDPTVSTEGLVTSLKRISIHCDITSCLCDAETSSANMERNILELTEPFLSAGRTKKNVPIAILEVPAGVIQNVKIFYVCCECGKVYWEGSHTRKALSGCLKYALSASKT